MILPYILMMSTDTVEVHLGESQLETSHAFQVLLLPIHFTFSCHFKGELHPSEIG